MLAAAGARLRRRRPGPSRGVAVTGAAAAERRRRARPAPRRGGMAAGPGDSWAEGGERAPALSHGAGRLGPGGAADPGVGLAAARPGYALGKSPIHRPSGGGLATPASPSRERLGVRASPRAATPAGRPDARPFPSPARVTLAAGLVLSRSPGSRAGAAAEPRRALRLSGPLPTAPGSPARIVATMHGAIIG